MGSKQISQLSLNEQLRAKDVRLNELERLKAKNDETTRRQQQKIDEFKNEIEILKTEKLSLNEQLKQREIECEQLKQRMIASDGFKNKHFSKWNAEEFLAWIVQLDAGKNAKYEKILRTKFDEQSVSGQVIQFMDKNDWNALGINNMMDRIALDRHVQGLKKEQNDDANNNNDDFEEQKEG